VRGLAVVTPGFLTEGLETLEEIAKLGARQFTEAGGEDFAYLPAVGDSEEFVAGLAGLVRARLATLQSGADHAAAAAAFDSGASRRHGASGP
jgi:ferrochelatase